MCLKEQTSQDVAQPLIGKVSLVKRPHHPVVKKIQLGIEKPVVRIERCAQQTSLRFEPALDGRACVRQHSAKRRNCPAVADELFKKTYILTNAAKRRIRID